MRGTTPGWGRVPPILDNPGQYICLKQNNIWKNNWAYLHYIMFKGGRLKTRDIKPISILQINRDDFYLVQWSMTMTIGQWSCPDSFFSYTLWLRRYALFDFVKTQLNHNQGKLVWLDYGYSNPPTTHQWNSVLLLFNLAVTSNITQTNLRRPK